MNDKMYADMRNKYLMHKYNVEKNGGRKDAAGNLIEFRLTEDEWMQIWLDSGHWHERGRKRGQYCMSRKDDLGHYEVGNVFIQPITANTSQAMTGKVFSKKRRKNISQALLKPCTVDGVTIFDCVQDLINALGKGQAGYRNPNLRYL